MGNFKNNTETHSYDEPYDRLVVDLRSVLGIIVITNDSTAAGHANTFMTRHGPPSVFRARPSPEEYEAYANARLAQEGPDLGPAEFGSFVQFENDFTD